MRTHLTRRVLRQILRNKPFTHSQCSRHLSYRTSRPRNVSLATCKLPARSNSFWAWLRRPKLRDLKPEDYDPGIELLTENEKHLKMAVRPFPRKEVIRAFNDLMQAKLKAPITPLLDTQVKPVIAAVKMLQSRSEGDEDVWLSAEDVSKALMVLTLGKRGKSEEEAELATVLFEYIKDRRPGGEAFASNRAGTLEYYKRIGFQKKVLRPYLQVLGRAGQGLQARKELEDQNRLAPELVAHPKYWSPVFQGLASSNDEEGIRSTVEVMKSHGIPYDEQCHASLILAYALQNDMEKVKKWYEFPFEKSTGSFADRSENLNGAEVTVLRLCIANGEFEWGQPILNKMLGEAMNKGKMDLTLQWAAASGKGVDEIERMMNVMTERHPDQESMKPDIDTINNLVEGANARNDPYTAERFLALAERLKISLNARTRILQMDYRLTQGDLDGARAAYKALKSHEIQSFEDVPVINKLILALTQQPVPNADEILNTTADLTDRHAPLSGPVIAALAVLHLNREEFDEVIDLLNTFGSHLSSSDRALVRDALVSLILSPTTDIGLAWDTYMILKEKFPEIANPLRLTLMTHFFSRNRVDMAVHAFGHIRQASLKEQRPDAAAYAACFRGLARMRHATSLMIVHNMLKLDSEVEPDTRLHEALMLAYMGCDDPDTGLDFWDEITYSREGPRYESICIALMCCQRAIHGARYAREIWDRLRRLEVEITGEVCVAYAAALVGKGFVQEALEVVGGMQRLTAEGRAVDVLT
ncbi:MAG: hypothetical protein LQ340_004743 [Diploschistes diacapsis]|nr:MAG: hypothetical protein LQ340_004743 [Diploschistes diacapsis]